MVIQECYDFNGVGVHWGSVQFFHNCCHINLFTFSANYWFLLLTVDIFTYKYLILKRRKNN